MNPLFIPDSPTGEYRCLRDLNLYNSPACRELATQAAAGRHLQIVSPEVVDDGVRVQLREDGYLAWLSVEDIEAIEPSPVPYQAIPVSRAEIEERIPDIIAFTESARNTPNHYLWGGTLAPNYDCSGLMQAAFSASGIWIPRDSYQQEAFCQTIHREELQPGDLIFFGNERINHVALYLGNNSYIHSSGKEMGRNGIGIDILSETGDEVSRNYFHKLRGFGRVMGGYTE
ncbi:C40 family peptidase [Pannus brasiliensis CCIBt3594]|uniref:C40 family peptidase n=1 Tax=Pannus brasiliensis CCIBt3594 TaxID=1427578 RepID=A0AAW9QSE0_9CHRO